MKAVMLFMKGANSKMMVTLQTAN